MIRALFLLLLFAAGLALAAVFQGRMHHLRQAVPERLPEWTETISADAGLLEGTMDLPAEGRWPATRLKWTARLPSGSGWVWDVDLQGEGVALAGQVVLGFMADKAVVSGVKGSVDLGALAAVPVPVQGIARIEALTGVVVDLRETPVVTGALEARVAGLILDGADFGAGPLMAELETSGAWRAELNLDDGVSPVQAVLVGNLTDRIAQLQAEFADGPALPAAMRAMLAAVGQAEGQGWQLEVAVPVP